MAVRNPLIIVSGLFQELNTSSDKLNFGGNTTADLSENTNLYYTNARARASVSVTDSGGDGSLAYNSSTGVITYTGPSASEVRAHISVASGSGLTYSSGEIGTSAIPNSQLANDDITIGSTAIALGATGSTIAGLTSLASGTLIAGVEDAANAIEIGSGNIIFEGSTANTYETILTAADTTGSDKTITLPNATGTVALTSDIVVTASSTTTFSNKTIALGSNTVSGTTAQFNTALTDGSFVTLAGSETLTNKTLTSPAINSAVLDAPVLKATSATVAGKILFKEGTDNGTNTVTLLGAPATADVVLTLPAETGTILSTVSSIANSNLANSSVTIGSTAISLGATTASIAGVTSITSAAVITDDDGFRVRDNSDSSKQLAFECSGITTSTTRTLTIPDANGTIATQAYVNAQITAEDLDVQTDSGNFDVDLDSEPLILTGGTGIDTSGSGSTATFAIDSTVATLTGSQTLTNKSLTSPAITGSLSGNAFLDEDNMASDSATKVASQQSIKAYVDAQITAEDLDVQTDSGNFDVDLDSEPLILTGGTGIDTSGSGTTATFAIDSTVATLVGSQTLTNKTIALGDNTVSGTLAQFNTAVTNATLVSTTGSETLTNKTLTSPVLNTGLSGTAFLDEDNMASDSATKVASQQSIKAYVDAQITAEDLDVVTDSGNFDVDLDSETLTLTGGTGIDTSGSGTTATFAIDSTVTTLTGSQTLTNKTLTSPAINSGILDAPVLKATSATVAGKILFKEGTDNGTNTVTLLGAASTADVVLTLPAETGTILSTATSIANSNLANSSVTIGSTAVALGATAASLAGVTSITSAAVVTDDNGFRIRDNSDNTKQLAFECSGISGSTTRTLTAPDASGTIATQAYVNAQITAEDLDVETDSGNFDVDLNSEPLILTGGTGIDTSGSGTTATFAIDSTVATLTGSQTLTNKTIVLGNNTVSGALADGITGTTQSASDNSTKVATTAYVDNQVTAGAVNEFADNVFRVKDNSDASKKLAFECSGISGSTTRTMTVPDENGTISTESFATAIAVALG
jgi:hypothetical protein